MRPLSMQLAHLALFEIVAVGLGPSLALHLVVCEQQLGQCPEPSPKFRIRIERKSKQYIDLDRFEGVIHRERPDRFK